MLGRLTVAAGVTVLLAGSAHAQADEHERRLSLQAQGAVVSVESFESSQSVLAGGGTLSLSRGLTDWLDIGADLAYLSRPNLDVDDAMLKGSGGPGFRVNTDLHAVELAAHTRVFGEFGTLTLLRPFVELRAGVGLRVLTSPLLIDTDGAMVTAAATDTSVFPLVGGGAGVSWRATDGFALAAAVGGSFGSAHQVTTVRLELSWFSFDWF